MIQHKKSRNRPHKKVTGKFEHLIFSPKGAVEGLLMRVDDAPMQVVVDPEFGHSTLLAELEPGTRIELESTPRKPSPKGESVHPVHELHKLLKIDGRKATADLVPSTFSGTVVRLNYAKHGEPNGVVLDSGDFVHLKPDGMARAAIKVGDRITASGEAQRLALGRGHVVEATKVNGKMIKRKPAHA